MLSLFSQSKLRSWHSLTTFSVRLLLDPESGFTLLRLSPKIFQTYFSVSYPSRLVSKTTFSLISWGFPQPEWNFSAFPQCLHFRRVDSALGLIASLVVGCLSSRQEATCELLKAGALWHTHTHTHTHAHTACVSALLYCPLVGHWGGQIKTWMSQTRISVNLSFPSLAVRMLFFFFFLFLLLLAHYSSSTLNLFQIFTTLFELWNT